jgi:hypothetical protein
MAAAYCNPAVASRREKYDDAFQIQTLLGAQPLKSSQYSPHSKEPNPQQAEQGHAQMQKCV